MSPEDIKLPLTNFLESRNQVGAATRPENKNSNNLNHVFDSSSTLGYYCV